VLETAGPKKKEDNQDEQAEATEGIETPLLAVAPNRENGHKGDEEKYRKDECQHVLDSP
jgi:hypothetical protein